MKKILFCITVVLAAFFLAGCATSSMSSRTLSGREGAVIKLGELCERYDLDYKYFPFAEEIVAGNDLVKIQMSPDYQYVVINGRVKNLGQSVVYDRGDILVPEILALFVEKYNKPGSFERPSDSVRNITTIVIDPGHGGRDPGAISPWGMQEKEVNLKIGRLLKKDLQNRGFKVYLTRNRDRYISLKQRVEFTKQKNADLFVSIHANAYRSRKIRGFEVYYLSPKFKNQKSKLLAVSENLCRGEGVSLSADLKQAVGKMINVRNRRITLEMASSILDSADNMGIYTRKMIGAPFYVLRYNLCPAVLVEVGYLTNKEEERLLRTSLYRKQLALAVAEGIIDLKKYINQRMVRRW